MEYISLSDIASYKQGKQVPVEEQSLYCENGMKRFVRIVDFTNPGEPPRYYFVTDPDGYKVEVIVNDK